VPPCDTDDTQPARSDAASLSAPRRAFVPITIQPFRSPSETESLRSPVRSEQLLRISRRVDSLEGHLAPSRTDYSRPGAEAAYSNAEAEEEAAPAAAWEKPPALGGDGAVSESQRIKRRLLREVRPSARLSRLGRATQGIPRLEGGLSAAQLETGRPFGESCRSARCLRIHLEAAAKR
jgi:hypothetical protein